jgi:hypothetical protein
MIPPRVLIPLVSAASAFGASGAVLALMGAGAPFLAAALGASACAGLVLYGLMSAAFTAPGYAALQARIDAIEARASSLRHDLRGALSPALILSDRLVTSTDPAIRKAGEAVVRSIEQASALIAASKVLEPPVAPLGSGNAPDNGAGRPLSKPGKAAGPAARPGMGS